MRHLPILLGGLALSACASATMERPSALAGAERLVIAGMNGINPGRYEVGGYSGQFRWSQQSFAMLGNQPVEGGRNSFTVAGPGIDVPIEGECRAHERAVDVRPGDSVGHSMRYRCSFSAGGKVLPASLLLEEGRSDRARPFARHGTMTFDGARFEVRSIHDVETVRAPIAAPIGYVIERDGLAVGAVELTGQPALLFARGSDANLRRDLTIAALALALLREPANRED